MITELIQKKDRVDDALQATKAALEEGIVPGGGMALLHARNGISDFNSIGGRIVYNVCAEPFKKILSNAGYELEDIYNALSGATGGGQAQGVGLPSTTPTMARIQAQGMGAQLQNMLSQVELNKATDRKSVV